MSGQPHHAYTEPDNAWRESALCKGMAPDIFYPAQSLPTTRPDRREPIVIPVQASNMCGLCPVAGDCLRAGLRDNEGVWGGTTGYERRWLRSVMQGRAIMDQRRPNEQRRAVVLGVAIRAGLLGGAE